VKSFTEGEILGTDDFCDETVTSVGEVDGGSVCTAEGVTEGETLGMAD